MAPEQFCGQPANARSDQFGFCVALYECLYGRHPFARGSARSLLELSESQATAPLRADAHAAHGVPSWLHAVLARGLHRDPARRYPSMDALLEALVRVRVRVPGRWPLAAVAAVALFVVSGLSYAVGALATPPVEVADGMQQGGTGPDIVSGPGAWSPGLGAGLGQGEPALASLPPGVAVLLWNLHAQFAPASALHATAVVLGQDVHLLLEQEIQHTRSRLAALRRWRDAMAALTAQPPRGPASRSHQPGARHRSAPPRQLPSRRTNALSLADVDSGLQSSWRDIQVCFREWRERQPHGRAVLDARVTIQPDGHARVQSVRFHDNVVRSCVAGAVQRSRFQPAATSTLVDLGFASNREQLALRSALVP
jgi:hypothetical protein